MYPGERLIAHLQQGPNTKSTNQRRGSQTDYRRMAEPAQQRRRLPSSSDKLTVIEEGAALGSTAEAADRFSKAES